jgi:hypothetical protein
VAENWRHGLFRRVHKFRNRSAPPSRSSRGASPFECDARGEGFGRNTPCAIRSRLCRSTAPRRQASSSGAGSSAGWRPNPSQNQWFLQDAYRLANWAPGLAYFRGGIDRGSVNAAPGAPGSRYRREFLEYQVQRPLYFPFSMDCNCPACVRRRGPMVSNNWPSMLGNTEQTVNRAGRLS